MRAVIAIVVSSVVLGACSKGENAGAEEAKKQAEAELKAKVDRGESAKKISPPVPGQQKSPRSRPRWARPSR
jgi:PBP1b-binding outer membrane lipoprotein LpoB